MNKHSDPKLKAAAEEIKAVLHKHDIAGMITLQGVGSLEFVREFSPSWSCARLEELSAGVFTIRVRAKAADIPSAAARKETIERTLGMFLGFHHQAQEDTKIMEQLVMMIAKQGIEFSNVIREG
ncbi:MAG: hypothetical protein E6R03_16430 [Hyphomicrobiaceae bacterium]|nr:MAG: hypothetical protein E6R03_16430 [Hyphomicrobiaceae bacterium]